MKFIALSICIVLATLGLGACEKHSASELPDHYLHKGSIKHAESEPAKAPAHGEAEKAPGEKHKG